MALKLNLGAHRTLLYVQKIWIHLFGIFECDLQDMIVKVTVQGPWFHISPISLIKFHDQWYQKLFSGRPKQTNNRVCSRIYRLKNNAYGVVVLTVSKEHWLQRKRIVSQNFLSNKSWEMTAVRGSGRVESKTQLDERVGPLVCHGRVEGELPIYVPYSTENRWRSPHVNRTLHGGVSLTMIQVRKRYWILILRRLVRKMRRKCRGYKRFSVMTYATPTTSKLPTTRTQGNNPYQVIGVDYAGKNRGQNGKAYVLL